VHENLFLSVCWADLLCLMNSCIVIFLFGIHLTAVLNTTLCLELTGSNGIFGDISDWFLRNTTSSGSQHSD
jgi:hypothetical protein